MIVFGHNSFLINSCKPSQLGLPEGLDQEYTIERRQRYFHLFWIPVFGLEKIWGLRSRKNNELYVPSALIEQALNALPLKEKTPWYTYSLLVLGLGAFILFFIYTEVNDYITTKRNAEYIAEKNASFEKAIQVPNANQYIELKDEHYKSVYLKFVGSYANTSQYLINTNNESNYSDTKMLEAFNADSLGKIDTISLAKSDLLKGINREANYNFQGHDILKNGERYVISDIKIYDFPVFKATSSGYENGTYYALLQNIGADGKYVSLDTSSTNLVLKPIQSKIASGKYLYLEGKFAGMEPQLNGKMTFTNESMKKSVYEISIYSSHLTISQLK